MQLIDMLKNSGAVHSMAQKIGIDDDQATAGAAALMPALLGGLEKQSRANSEGLSGVASMLGGLGGGDMLDQVLSSNSPDVNAGNGVLGQLFGSKDVSRAVAQNASSSTGLDPALLKKMLPLLAMVVGGYVAKQAQARNAQRTGTDTQTTQSAGGGLGGMLGSLFGGDQDRGGKGGLESLLGFGGKSNALDDVLKGLGGGGKPH
jgi:hypothetical protein